MIGWLRSFNTERPYDARETTELARVKCGERDDYWWARITPPLERGEAGNPEPLEVVLLAARHVGDRLDSLPVTSPVHVYVCTVKGLLADTPPEVDPKNVDIRHWGVLYPTKESASSGAL